MNACLITTTAGEAYGVIAPSAAEAALEMGDLAIRKIELLLEAVTIRGSRGDGRLFRSPPAVDTEREPPD